MAMEVEEKQSSSDMFPFPYWKSLPRKFPPNSPFFSPGNLERELLAKQVALDLTEIEKQQIMDMELECERSFYCPVVGCGARLTSLDVFEDHYRARHTASCSVCSRVYPTERLLSIHVSEVHDSFFQAKAARGYAVYECLVETCGLKFKDYYARHQHLIDKHKFPASFEFYKKVHRSKKQRQKLKKNKALHKKEEASNAMQIENEAIDGLVSAVSRLSTADSVPSSVSFGRRHTRGLTFVPRSLQRDSKSDLSSDAPKT